jgi:hypothetical protein
VRFNSKDDFIPEKDFLTNIPHYGVIDFDYVSTTRPRVRDSTSAAANIQASLMDTIASPRSSSSRARKPMDEEVIPINEDLSLHPFSPSNRSSAISFQEMISPNSKKDAAKIINDDEFHRLITKLGLHVVSSSNNNHSKRSVRMEEKIVQRNAVLILVELQHAAAKYYFPCSKVIKLLELFPQDIPTQAKVTNQFTLQAHQLIS